MSDIEWARQPGSLAWAILPTTETNSTNKKNNSTNHSYYWPVILYPSWSYAAKHSGLIPSSTKLKSKTTKNNVNENENKIKFIGCKTAVTIEQMSRNLVPKRVALGCSSVKGKALRPKVVAYFLGMGDNNENSTHTSSSKFTESAWCAVHVASVKEYTIDNCKEMLFKFSNPSERERKPLNDSLWSSFILAMEEASIVSERREFNPRVWMMKHQQPSIDNKSSGPRRKKNKYDAHENRGGNSSTDGSNGSSNVTDDGQDIFMEELTPECFDNWRDGGDTEKYGETQSQFVFSAGTCM
jgi:hypothetical protein